MIAFIVCLCVLMTLLPGAALAATNERTTRPTVKVSSKDTIRPGAQCQIVVSCSKPGFLSARILDGEAMEVAEVCEEMEVPSGKTTLSWDGVLDNGRMAETGGKYSIALTLRDEWGNETKSEVVNALKIGELRPAVSDVAFTYDAKNKAWVITGTASMKGYLMIDLYMASNLNDCYMRVANGYEKKQKNAQISEANQSFALAWDGKVAVEDDGKIYYYPLDPGYYALGVYLDDAEGIRSEKSIIYVSVDGDAKRTPYITGEEPDTFSLTGEKKQTAQSDTQAENSGAQATGETTARPALAGPTESIKGENGLTVGVVMGDEGLQIGAGVSDTAEQAESSYWTISADATDEEIWAALTRPMISVNEDERNSVSVLATPESNGKKVAQVNGLTQGLNVVGEVGDWSIVEVYRNEDSAFTRGYIRTSRLRTVEPDQEYGLTIDKTTQTLTVWHNGERVGSVPVCTGLANAENPGRETPAGEYILATRMGTREMQMGYCEYAIRLSGDVWIHEIPSTVRKGTDFSVLQGVLGEKATRGTIAVAHESSEDGAINMEWIWETLSSHKRAKVLIFDDKDRDVVPYLDPSDYQ